MTYQHILGRIRSSVARDAYLAGTGSVPAGQLAAMQEVAALVADPYIRADSVRRRIHQLHASGRLDRVMKLSALGVLAASPRVRDFAEASRLAGQQELVALEEGGPHREVYLASADRHRGVLAFLLGHHEVALDWFGRALERERSVQNVGNVLACLLQLGDTEAATDLMRQVLQGWSEHDRHALEELIGADDDLAPLRAGAAQG